MRHNNLKEQYNIKGWQENGDKQQCEIPVTEIAVVAETNTFNQLIQAHYTH